MTGRSMACTRVPSPALRALRVSQAHLAKVCPETWSWGYRQPRYATTPMHTITAAVITVVALR